MNALATKTSVPEKSLGSKANCSPAMTLDSTSQPRFFFKALYIFYVAFPRSLLSCYRAHWFGELLTSGSTRVKQVEGRGAGSAVAALGLPCLPSVD